MPPPLSTVPSRTANSPRSSLHMVDAPGDLALLRYDLDLRGVIDAGDLPLAERTVSAQRITLPEGPCLSAFELEPGELAILLDGVLVQEVHLSGRSSTQLLSRGSILHDLHAYDSGLPCEMALTSVGPSTLAVLDHRFTMAARRWPALWEVIHQRLAEQLKTAARWSAVTALPRAEQRVLAAFWLIADRWGVRRKDGIAIHMPLTHELIGTMVAARRPTVSLALADLAERQMLTSVNRCDWLLNADAAPLLRQ